ncbi:hypothetical protein [Streptomyces sp. NPDC090445]|uniref:hypothetical protein n=1 Tax=Streptomyces sp. NPDC090445 TaxID=3365963 RepID=UPI0038287F1E
MTTLGELFDASLAHLAAAARDPHTPADPEECAALAGRVDHVLQQIRKGLGPETNPLTTHAATQGRSPAPAADDPQEWLTQASGRLNRARQYLQTPGDGAAGPSGTRIEAAGEALAAVRDTIGSHLGPDGAPLTPYACLLRHRAAADHLASRYAEVGQAAGQVVHRIAQHTEHPGAAEAFAEAVACLDQAAAVLTHPTARDAAPHLSALPLALPVIPVQALPTDPTTAVTARLAEDSERLSSAAYLALHDHDEHRLSDSDLHHMAHWNSLTRLLAGRVLTAATPALPHAYRHTAHDFTRAATALRESAAAWRNTAAAWQDVTDPREHPPLPHPHPHPHPATVVSRTTATRLGGLLYGARWTPAATPGPARPATEILTDAGGPGPLAASLYRLPSTGWQMAYTAPWAPWVAERPGALVHAYSAVMAVEQQCAGQLLNAAHRTGTPVPRALLDAAAHQALATEQRSAPAPRIRPAPYRPVPRAAVPRELMRDRRPGLRR